MRTVEKGLNPNNLIPKPGSQDDSALLKIKGKKESDLFPHSSAGDLALADGTKKESVEKMRNLKKIIHDFKKSNPNIKEINAKTIPIANTPAITLWIEVFVITSENRPFWASSNILLLNNIC